MRYGTVATITALTIGFWALVWFVADAFEPLELALIVTGLVVFFGVWMAWEVRHAVVDPEEDTEMFVPADWEWSADDTSTVRHGGLGR